MTLQHFLHGPFLLELQKPGASIWMIPEALTHSQSLLLGGGENRPKTNQNQTTKYVRRRSKDGTNTCFGHLSPSAQLH